MSHLAIAGWCLEPSQPKRIITGLTGARPSVSTNEKNFPRDEHGDSLFTNERVQKGLYDRDTAPRDAESIWNMQSGIFGLNPLLVILYSKFYLSVVS